MACSIIGAVAEEGGSTEVAALSFVVSCFSWRTTFVAAVATFGGSIDGLAPATSCDGAGAPGEPTEATAPADTLGAGSGTAAGETEDWPFGNVVDCKVLPPGAWATTASPRDQGQPLARPAQPSGRRDVRLPSARNNMAAPATAPIAKVVAPIAKVVARLAGSGNA